MEGKIHFIYTIVLYTNVPDSHYLQSRSSCARTTSSRTGARRHVRAAQPITSPASRCRSHSPRSQSQGASMKRVFERES